MVDNIRLILSVDESKVALVLNKINKIGGALVDDDENRYIGDNIKIVCKIDVSSKMSFSDWLSENSITIYKEERD